MDAGDSECAAVQGAAGPDHGPGSHSRDRHRVLPFSKNHEQTQERSKTAGGGQLSGGNDGPWKARKTKCWFSILPTVLGHPPASRMSTVPPRRRSLLYKGQTESSDLKPLTRGWIRLNCRNGPSVLAKRTRRADRSSVHPLPPDTLMTLSRM